MNKNPHHDLSATIAVSPSFEDLAGRQGVRPVEDFAQIVGHPSAEDESIDEFAAMLRKWRDE